MASAQLGQIHDIMEQHTLVDGKDRRQSMMLKKNGELDSSLLYRAMKTAYSEPDEWTKFVWHNKAPPRVKFFAWLLSQERIQSKTLLRRKGVVDHIECEVCQAAEETTAHIIFGCSYASQFWGADGIQTDAAWPIQALKDIQPPSHIPAKYLITFLLLSCWHIWKRRNNAVFRSERTALNASLAACKTEAFLWVQDCQEMTGQ
jgi:hypothetical protein